MDSELLEKISNYRTYPPINGKLRFFFSVMCYQCGDIHGLEVPDVGDISKQIEWFLKEHGWKYVDRKHEEGWRCPKCV